MKTITFDDGNCTVLQTLGKRAFVNYVLLCGVSTSSSIASQMSFFVTSAEPEDTTSDSEYFVKSLLRSSLKLSAVNKRHGFREYS